LSKQILATRLRCIYVRFTSPYTVFKRFIDHNQGACSDKGCHSITRILPLHFFVTADKHILPYQPIFPPALWTSAIRVTCTLLAFLSSHSAVKALKPLNIKSYYTHTAIAGSCSLLERTPWRENSTMKTKRQPLIILSCPLCGTYLDPIRSKQKEVSKSMTD
jgi:hypothetical protein